MLSRVNKLAGKFSVWETQANSGISPFGFSVRCLRIQRSSWFCKVVRMSFWLMLSFFIFWIRVNIASLLNE